MGGLQYFSVSLRPLGFGFLVFLVLGVRVLEPRLDNSVWNGWKDTPSPPYSHGCDEDPRLSVEAGVFML